MRMRFGLALAVTLFSLLPVRADRFYVDGTPPADEETPAVGDDRRSVQAAKDPATPFRTIAHALAVAHQITQGRPHVIDVAPGTYSPSNGQTFPLVITETDILLEFDDSGATFFDAEGQSGFLRILTPAVDYVIQHVRFSNAAADSGGAIFSRGAGLRVIDCRFFDNTASKAGQVIYAEDGRLQLYKNLFRDNGAAGSTVPLIEIHNVVDPADPGDDIRNNTFYGNTGNGILTSGNKTLVNSNIFSNWGEGSVITEAQENDDPYLTYNFFWETPILYISSESDSIKLSRTIRDTTFFPDPSVVPDLLVQNIPDTINVAGDNYQYILEVEFFVDQHDFIPITLPPGAAVSEAPQQGLLFDWTTSIEDLGRHNVQILIRDPFGVEETLDYYIHVFEEFPDLTIPEPDPPFEEMISFVPDTTGAVDDLSMISAVFAGGVTALRNFYIDPLMLDPEVGRYELPPASPGFDGGDPNPALNDGSGNPNDAGFTGGPPNAYAPAPGSFADLLIATLPDSLAVEGQEYVYDPVLDPNEPIIIVDFLAGPPTMSDVFGKAPPITWTPTIADTGSYFAGIELFRTTGQRGRHFWPLRVKPANERLVISSDPVTEALEDQSYAYQIDATDPNGHTITYSLVSGPAGLVVDPAGGLVQWSPTQDDLGEYTVDILLDDGAGETKSHVYSLTVLNTNDPPSLSAVPDATAVEDTAFEITLVASDPDPDEVLTYTVTAGPAAIVIDATGALSWTPVQANVGEQAITVEVSDQSAETASQSFSVTVVEVDEPPTINSVPVLAALEDAQFNYAIVAADEEDEALEYFLNTAPAGMTVDVDGLVTWLPDNGDVGDHAVDLEVADATGNRTPQSFVLTVQNVNDAPVVTTRSPTDELVISAADEEVTLSVEVWDEEGDDLTFSWTKNGDAVANATTASLMVTITASDVDTYVLTISDGMDDTDVQWVVDPRQIPRFVAQPASADFGSVTIGSSGQVIIEIQNIGSQDLAISGLQVGDLQYSAIFSTSFIGPGITAELDLRFNPNQRGASASTIGFTTSDPDNADVEISLAGEGVVPTQLSLDLNSATGSQALTDTTIGSDQPIQLSIYAAETLDLVAYDLTLAFDPAHFSFASFQAAGEGEDNVLAAPGVALLANATEPEPGSVEISVSAQVGAAGTSADGLLGIASFQATDTFAGELVSEISVASASLQSADLPADVLMPTISVQLRARPALVGDFDNNGIVNLFDFFDFTGAFDSTDARFDLDNNGIVNLLDFFEFAGNFGATAGAAKGVFWPSGIRLEPAEIRSLDGIVLHVEEESRGQLVVGLNWSGEQPPAGFAIAFDFDPLLLRWVGYRSSPSSAEAIDWPVVREPGQWTLAVGHAGVGRFAETDLGSLVFDRISEVGTTVGVHGALAFADGKLTPLSTPAELFVPPLPDDFTLYPAYPNPFNPTTTVRLFLPHKAEVRVTVYDILGQPVRELVYDALESGHHEFVWNGNDSLERPVATGMYFVVLHTGSFRELGKLMLLK